MRFVGIAVRQRANAAPFTEMHVPRLCRAPHMSDESFRVDSAEVRITTSQLWDTLSSLSILRRYGDRAPWPYTRWSEWAYRHLQHSPKLTSVRWWQEQQPAPWPEFVRPLAVPTGLGLRKELAALRSGADAVLAEWAAKHVPREALPGTGDDPTEAVNWLADGFAAYWELALAPLWNRMGVLLDDELLHRAKTLATEGPAVLLSQVSARRGAQFRRRGDTGSDRRGHTYVMPLIFYTDDPATLTDDAGNVVIVYRAGGVATLAEAVGDTGGTAARPAEASTTSKLGVLIGRGRSMVLKAVDSPNTTAGLADELSLAPSTVSEHLATLTEAGLVSRRRVGRHVLYEVNSVGAALVRLMDESMDWASLPNNLPRRSVPR
ncbi:ArsR family transcriptional regulator [Micromonospora sp. NPDC002717]|uniref:ArsR/SmtB family transcription factor n=1 Tax=Micromonospora sp. NPDC002717 TaxID=3154424 RepID=UPI00331CC27B